MLCTIIVCIAILIISIFSLHGFQCLYLFSIHFLLRPCKNNEGSYVLSISFYMTSTGKSVNWKGHPSPRRRQLFSINWKGNPTKVPFNVIADHSIEIYKSSFLVCFIAYFTIFMWMAGEAPTCISSNQAVS